MNREIIRYILKSYLSPIGNTVVNNPNGVGPLVEQGWRVKRAYPV